MLISIVLEIAKFSRRQLFAFSFAQKQLQCGIINTSPNSARRSESHFAATHQNPEAKCSSVLPSNNGNLPLHHASISATTPVSDRKKEQCLHVFSTQERPSGPRATGERPTTFTANNDSTFAFVIWKVSKVATSSRLKRNHLSSRCLWVLTGHVITPHASI